MGNAEQGEARFQWRCPACGVWTDKPVAPCDGCTWMDPVGAQQARDRLAGLNRSGAPLAFLRSGCRVCPTCREQFRAESCRCPLRVFYLGLRAWAFSQKITSPVAAHNAACALFQESLEARGFPEEIEGYWWRLLARLQRLPGSGQQKG